MVLQYGVLCLHTQSVCPMVLQCGVLCLYTHKVCVPMVLQCGVLFFNVCTHARGVFGVLFERPVASCSASGSVLQVVWCCCVW